MTNNEYAEPSVVEARLPSCAVAYFNSVLDTAESLGLDRKSLLADVGLEPESVAQPNNRIPMETLIRVLKRGAQLSGNPDFGLHVGPNVHAGSFGLLGYLSLCSRNIQENSELMIKFKRLVFDAGETVLHVEGDRTVYTWKPLKQEYLDSRFLVDAIFSGWVCFSSTTSMTENFPERIELTYDKPDNTELYQTLFACDIEFGCEQNRMFISTAKLTRPSPQANDAIFASLSQHARSFLSELNAQESAVASVRYHLFRLLPKGDASIDTVAEMLGLNRRTLQRKLSAESTQFRDVLNGIRSELAEQYLRDYAMSMLDVALLLGFSDSSAFASWFRSMQGVAPSEYREGFSKESRL